MSSIPWRRLGLIVLALVATALTVTGAELAPQQREAVQAQEPAADEEVRTAVVERGNLREIVSSAARVEPAQRVNLTFIESAPVDRVEVQVGDRVREGQALVALDTSVLELDILDAEMGVDLQRLALEQLRAGPSQSDLAAARAAVQQAQAQYNQLATPVSDEAVRLAQGQLQLRESERAISYQRWTDALNLHNQDGQHPDVLVAQKQAEAAELAVQIATLELANAQEGVSESDLAAARAQVSQAQATLSRLQAGPSDIDVQLAELGVEQAEAVLESAQARLLDAVLVAPFSGVVAAVNVRPGEQAVAGFPAVALIDDSTYFLEMAVDEIDIVRVEAGQPAVVTLDAYPDSPLEGVVERVSPVGSTVGVVTTYDVRVALEPTDVALRDGMTATVDVIVAELSDVLLVPNWAIRFDRATGQAYASVLRGDGTIEEVEIEIGTRGEAMSEVLGGLEEQDVVVVSLAREGFDIFAQE